MAKKIQRCEVCDEPTGRCEDDALTATDEITGDQVILCESCYDAAASGIKKVENGAIAS